MAIDPRLWTNLEQYGLTAAHLRALLRLLQSNANGSFTWHVRDNKIDHCGLTLTCSSRPHELQRVSEVVLALEGD